MASKRSSRAPSPLTVLVHRYSMRARIARIERLSQSRFEGISHQLDRLYNMLREPRLAAPTDPGFLEAASMVIAHGRTKLAEDRLWILWQAARNTGHLGQAAAEVGAYRGGSAYFIALAYQMQGHEVALDVIDTFEGHPQDRLSEYDPPSHKGPGAFAATSYEEVLGYLSPFPHAVVHKGALTTVAESLPDRTYQFVHVDVDLYESTRDCLEYFAGRMAGGGVIVLDDYDAPNCPGVRRAAEEFLSADGGWQAWQPHTEQLLLIKTT